MPRGRSPAGSPRGSLCQPALCQARDPGMMDTPWPESSKDRDMPVGSVRDWGCHQAWAAKVGVEGRARMQPGSLSLALSLPTMSYREEREALGMLPGGGSLELCSGDGDGGAWLGRDEKVRPAAPARLRVPPGPGLSEAASRARPRAGSPHLAPALVNQTCSSHGPCSHRRLMPG